MEVEFLVMILAGFHWQVNPMVYHSLGNGQPMEERKGNRQQIERRKQHEKKGTAPPQPPSPIHATYQRPLPDGRRQIVHPRTSRSYEEGPLLCMPSTRAKSKQSWIRRIQTISCTQKAIRATTDTPNMNILACCFKESQWSVCLYQDNLQEFVRRRKEKTD